MRPLINETDNASRAARRAAKSYGLFGSIGKRAMSTFTSYAAAGIGAYALVNLGREAYRAAQGYEALEVSMQAAFGSQAEGTKQLEYSEHVAKKYALDIFAVGDGWAKIALSAKAADMPMKDAQEIFENTAASASAFNLSADDTKGAMRAIVQMLGKGKINAEDMRQQLAERIPAAMPILAKSLGVTYGEMEDMMARGELGAEKLVGWSQTMAKMVKDSGALAKSLTTMRAGQTWMMNSLKKSAKILFEGGIDGAMGRLFGTFANFMDTNQETVGAIGEAIASMVDGFTNLFDIVSPFIGAILKGWGEIYKLVSETSMVDLADVGKLDPFMKTIRWITGELHLIKNGWLSIGGLMNSILSEPELHINAITFAIERFIQTMRKWTGMSYTDDAGEQHQGWGADGDDAMADFATTQSQKAAAAITNTNSSVVNSKEFKFIIDGVEFASDSLMDAVNGALDMVNESAIDPVGR